MQNYPLVSVLLPVYNSEKYIHNAIQSVLNQTFKNFELIVLNDGSSDSSLEIAEHYADTDKRVRVYSHENRGICRTLQKGVNLALGKYTARMDADDIALPQRFEQQVQYLENNPSCVVLGTGTIVIDPQDNLLYAVEVTQGHEAILLELLQWKGSRICHPTVMMRTDAVRAVGGYVQEYHWEDIDLFLKLAKVGQLENLPQKLLKHRLHLSSITHTRNNDTKLNEIKQEIYLKAIENLHLSTDFCQQNNLSLPQPIDTSDYYSEYEVYCRWSIFARRSGFYTTSVKYLYKIFAKHPFKPKTYWTFLYCLFGEKYSSLIWNILLKSKQYIFKRKTFITQAK
jgi:glycosyltransferase involved in cell wall biosynthesis